MIQALLENIISVCCFTGVSLVAFDQLSGCATKIVMLVHVFIVSDSCYKIFLGHTSYTLNFSS